MLTPDRICFAWEDEDMLAEGIGRLGRVIRTILDEQGGSGQPGPMTPRDGTESHAKEFW